MARKKRIYSLSDFKHHILIAHSMLQGRTCRQAVKAVVAKAYGDENVLDNDANYQRLYRKHLKYKPLFRKWAEGFRLNEEWHHQKFEETAALLPRKGFDGIIRRLEEQHEKHRSMLAELERQLALHEIRFELRKLAKSIFELRLATLLFCIAAYDEQAGDQTPAALNEKHATMEEVESRILEAIDNIIDKLPKTEL